MRALVVEDRPDDAELTLLELGRAGFAVDATRVDRESALRAALADDGAWDIVLCDHKLPGLGDAQALTIVRETAPELPVIVVSGHIGEDAAAAAIRHGARDFVSKHRIRNLGPAVQRTLREVQTERDHAAAATALRESETRLEAFLATTNDGMSLLSAVRDDHGRIVDFHYIYNNAASDRLARQPPATMEGRRLTEVFGADAEPFAAAFRRVVETGEPLHMEQLFPPEVDPEQPVIELAVDVRIVKHDDGVAVVARDITERKRDELERERLHRRLSRVYSLVVAASMAIVRATSVEDLYRSVCRTAIDPGGFRLAWIGALDPDTRRVEPVAADGVVEYLDGVNIIVGHPLYGRGPTGRAIAERRPTTVNLVADSADLAPWVERIRAHGVAATAAFPLYDGDRVIGTLSLYSSTSHWFSPEETALLTQLADDISLAARMLRRTGALRRTEHFLETLTNGMSEGLYALDEAGRVTFMNEAAEQLLGWALDDLGDLPLHDAIHPDHAPQAPCDLLDAVHGGPPVTVVEDTFTRRDGRRLPVSYSAAPLVLRNPDPLAPSESAGVVLVFGDNTERKSEELERLRELETLSWVGRIREALDAGRMVLYRQPIIDVRSRRVVSNELLLRMLDVQGGVIEPGAFLPAAERFGLIGEIDLWVLGEAAKLAAAGHRVNFNLSADTLGRRDLVARMARMLAASGGSAANLTCEITETAIAADPATAEAAVRQLADSGCAVALDDFGTGYGGFSYLKRLPVRHIKIDMDFVRNLADSSENQHVVQAIVNLAHGFAQETTAEGVEDAATFALLVDYGVDYAQGFAIGRPVPATNPPVEWEGMLAQVG